MLSMDEDDFFFFLTFGFHIVLCFNCVGLIRRRCYRARSVFNSQNCTVRDDCTVCVDEDDNVNPCSGALT